MIRRVVLNIIKNSLETAAIRADDAANKAFDHIGLYLAKHPEFTNSIELGIHTGIAVTENVIIGVMKYVLAHQVFEKSEALCKKLFLAHGHKIDCVEWEFNTCQLRCNRCRVRLFFNITIAGGHCEFEVFMGKGVASMSLGSTDMNDKRKILSRRYNDYLCDKVSSLM